MNDESRPEAAHEIPATASTAILPEPVPSVTDDPSVDGFFRGAYAVLVRGKSVRRHLYLSLAAAERTVRLARGRGDRADMILVQLVPVRGGRNG